MIETSLLAWLVLFLTILVSSAAGIAIAQNLPWNKANKDLNMPFTFGLAIAPYILGAFTLVALHLLPGLSHNQHYTFILIGLIITIIGFSFFSKDSIDFKSFFKFQESYSISEKLLFIFLIAQTLSLILNTVLMPLMQNDSLEYASVGKVLYEARDIAAYPVLEAKNNSWGFLGPWTHPPLYFSLIYLMNIIQVHIDAPGLMRIITLWTTLSSTALLFTIAKRRNRNTALISSILYLSAPLFLLGTASSLIDSIYLSASLIVLATLSALDTTTLKKGVITGIFLGMALWTHSQAILLIPMVCFFVTLQYWGNWGKYFWVRTLAIVAPALAIASPPYLKNYRLFNSLISDNPPVLALKQLDFDSYFAIVRGLSSFTAKIQYGFLKGFFTIETYGIIYWLTLPLLIMGLFNAKKSITYLFEHKWLLAVVAFLFCYFSGVLTSIIIGTDLMIKNERYFLLVHPLISLIAAISVDKYIFGQANVSSSQKIVKRLSIFLVSAVLIAQFISVTTYWTKRLKLDASSLGLNQYEKLKKWSPFNSIDYLNLNTEKDALVLTLKPADMYYSQRKMLSYLDPILIPLYEETNIKKGFEFITKKMGVKYIHGAAYSLPPAYNSIIFDLMKDPKYTTLKFEEGGYRILELIRRDSIPRMDTLNFSLANSKWLKETVLTIGGRKDFAQIPLTKETIDEKNAFISNSGALFDRDKAVVLTSDQIPFSSSLKGELNEKLIHLDMEGESLLKVKILYFDSNGKLIEDNELDEMPLTKHFNPTYRILPKENVKSFKISLKLKGVRYFKLNDAFIAENRQEKTAK